MKRRRYPSSKRRRRAKQELLRVVGRMPVESVEELVRLLPVYVGQPGLRIVR